MIKKLCFVAILACLILPSFATTCYCDCNDGSAYVSTGDNENVAIADCMLRRFEICIDSTFNKVRCVALTPLQIGLIAGGGVVLLIAFVFACWYLCCRHRTKHIHIHGGPVYVQHHDHHAHHGDHGHHGHHHHAHH